MSATSMPLQSEASECGLVCLAVAANRLGAGLAMADLRRQFPPAARGTSLQRLIEIAGELRLQARAIRCEPDDLATLDTPSLLHWRGNHFVVLLGRRFGKLRIFDPAVGELHLTLAELSRDFTGVALELRTDAGFERRKQPSPLSIFSFIQLSDDLVKGLGYALFFSVLLQAFAIITPMFLQVSVDSALSQSNEDFYLTVALGFGALCVLNVLLEGIRSFLVGRISLHLSWGMTRRLFRQMLRLPLPWFQRRRLADAVSRFDSIAHIRQLVSGGFVSSMLDAVLLVFLLGAVAFYSIKLALLMLVSTLIVVAIRLGTVGKSMSLGAQQLQADIAERGFRIETVRAMQSIKAAGAELQRESVWASRFAATIMSAERQERFRIVTQAAASLVEGLSAVALTYIGVQESRAGVMTIGALYAVLSYRQQFTNRTGSLLTYLVSWRQTDLHSHRVADIALSPSEQALHAGTGRVDRLDGSFETKHLSFRYSPADPVVLDNISFTAPAGSFIAITGPSGAGKSTLLKILATLYPPSAGEIRLDGAALSTLSLNDVRARIGTVLQEDELLAGTIADNVSFFSQQTEVDWVWECLRMAQMDRDVRALPMQLSTDVGDMGSTFSAGQRQRLILARALYKRPSILLLDEATAHLDPANEARIHDVLKQMAITRIAVAHRPEMVALADQVFHLQNGRLTAVPRAVPTPAAAPARATVQELRA